MRRFVGVALMGILAGLAASQSTKRAADLILRNGLIHTVDEKIPMAEAVAVAGDRIVFVGANRESKAYRGPTTKIIDLQGKTVVPGFIDSHYHFQGVGRREYDLNLDGCTSVEEFLSRIRKWAATKKPGEWVTGRGWMEEDWPTKRFPTRHDIDVAVPGLPVYLTRADGHMAAVNSRALQIAGIGRDTPNPQGGEILKEASGEPSGLLVDRAMNLVNRHIPATSKELQEKYALEASARALSYGLTTIHDAGSDWGTIDLWKKLYEQGKMQVRIYTFVRGPGADAQQLLQNGPQIGLFNNHLTVRGIKIVIDGALGSRGAALLDSYADENTTGLLIYKEEEIYPTIKAATQKGIQMAIHAIGDAANRKVLDLYERALNEVRPDQRMLREPRHRIEHAQVVHPMDMPRFSKLGVIPSMQPSHAIGDLHFAARRLGQARMSEAYAWRDLLDMGCMIASGSDAPVEEGNPLIEFYAACVRKDTTGFSGEGWLPEMKMTREEALRSLTLWGAYAGFEEEFKGSLTAGKLADMVVLDQDLMTAPEETLHRIRVIMAVVAGKVVYAAPKGSGFPPHE